MRREALDILRCPACRGTLNLPAGEAAPEVDEGELNCAACGRAWQVRRGIPRLVFPEELGKEDASVQRFWDRIASTYDIISKVTAIQRGMPETTERRELARRLKLSAGDSVLEVAAGTGSNLKVIAEECGD